MIERLGCCILVVDGWREGAAVVSTSLFEGLEQSFEITWFTTAKPRTSCRG